jgi:thioredoxin 1
VIKVKSCPIEEVQFEGEVLQSVTPVLVDFGADWCKPCIQLDPLVEELAQEWDGKVKVVKVDIDVSLNIAMQYGVMSVPTLILFIDGEPVHRMSGFVPKARLIHEFGPYLEQ